MDGTKNRASKKICSNLGETIAETLIALLISALALVMLAGAISSAANAINKSDKKMGEYYENDAKLVAKSGTDGPIELMISSESGAIEKYTVKYTQNDAFASKPVIAY